MTTGRKNHKSESESESTTPPLGLEREIKHAETGYKNAQDIIKFMDTKSGVIAGFAFVGIGFVLQVAKEFLSIPTEMRSLVIDQFKSHPVWAYVIFAIALVSLAAGVACVWCVVRCVTARPPHITSNLKHTFLFPFYGTKSRDLDCAMAYYAKVKIGLTAAEIAAEYEIQLLNVGAILCKKITWHRRAANAFLLQLALLTTAGAVFLSCFFLFNGSPHALAQQPAASAPTFSTSNTPPPPLPARVPSNPTPSSTP